tara:strand:+ start:56 stop:259 length:204 start_codon:yes stop_codon:yes gene_type:complete
MNLQVPTGSVTVSEYAKQYCISNTTARSYLDKFTRKGLLEKHQMWGLRMIAYSYKPTNNINKGNVNV